MRVFNAGKRNRLVSSRGMVLIAVLIFMATIVPVTILILDSVRLESLIPINENYVEIADKQAELGYYEAIALIMEDEHLIGVDPSREIPDNYQNPMIGAQDFIYKPYHTIQYDVDMILGIIAGTHDIDYLAEPWARHPDNRTYFILERSLENTNHILNLDPGDELVSSVPARWQLQDVPIGMDDFGELILDYYNEVSDEPGLMPIYENYRLSHDDRDPIGATHLAPHSITQYDPTDNEHSFDWPIASYMDVSSGTDHETNFDPDAEVEWKVSPADPGYIWPNQYPRPASYFRNARQTGVDGYSPENLVYDSLYDGDETTNQYLPNAELQEAVAKSTWANTFFGNPYTNNKEYKPAPGNVYPAPIGSEGDVLPAWHETIISDESGRFPINLLMNIIFTSHNYDYYDDGDTDAPVVERDWWDDVDYDELVNNEDHPNHYGYMLAKDMVISLLLTDQDLRGESPAPRDTPYNAYVYYEDKAEWVLRQMLYKRYKIDEMTDYNADGTWDETYGENDAYSALSILDGNGRRGDGPDMWDGTWNIYNDPKSILSDYAQDSQPSVDARPTVKEFQRLNQRVTVYSFDTEFIADFQQNSQTGVATEDLVRLNINRIQLEDVDNTPEFDESRGYGILESLLGDERAKSILRWRNGVVDLNGDGDLDDEFIEQPIREPLDDEPISTITYRERGHPNFQDPNPPLTAGNNSNHILFDPDYLNIPNLGSLLTIPMSVETGQIIYSRRQTDTFGIYTFNPDAPAPPGALIPTASSDDYPQYPNLNSLGTEFLVQDSSDGTSYSPIDMYGIGGGIIDNNVVLDYSWHPSYNYDNTKFCHVREEGGNRQIYVYDILAGTDTPITGALTPGIEIDGTFPFGTIIRNETGLTQIPDFLSIDISAPDYSPASNDIVFSAGNNDSAFDADDTTTYSSTNHLIYRISDTGFGGPIPLSQDPTDLTAGVHDVCPVFVSMSSGDWVIFSRLDLSDWDTWPRPPGQPMQFPRFFGRHVTLWAVPANGGTAVPIDLANNGVPDGSPYHFQLFPTVSPDNSQLAFVAITLDFPVDLGDLSFNIYTIPLALPPSGQILDSGINELLDSGSIVLNTGVAWCPDWGLGPTLLAYQRDTHSGFRDPLPLPMTGIDPADRELLAVELQDASIALRVTLENAVYHQQFRFRDYPGVTSLQVLALQQIYDKFSVRDPRVYNPQENPANDYDNLYLQAYSPRININTAPRPVLRTILLAMFQGPVWDDWDNYVVGPAPRGDDGAGVRPINLAQPITETNENTRLLAIQIADTYAHQIDEYRRWVYNNRGVAGITMETVPDKLELLLVDANDAEQRYNLRGNPFYPIDLDNNPDSIDKPFYDPAPPFRSVADLFRVMLYDAEFLGDDWRAEGIDSIYGPDQDDLPETIDVSTGNPSGDINAVDVWGPIYIEAGTSVTHGGEIGTSGTIMLPGFDNHESIQADPPGNLYVHSEFRLFSADDFKHVEQYFTTRTYVYRIESRGVVRIGSGVNRMDITRDKFWIVSVNRDAVAGYDDDGNPGDPDGLTSDSFGLFHADPGKWYSVIAYEEQQQGGFKLTRDNFTPPKYFDRSR